MLFLDFIFYYAQKFEFWRKNMMLVLKYNSTSFSSHIKPNTGLPRGHVKLEIKILNPSKEVKRWTLRRLGGFLSISTNFIRHLGGR